MAIEANPNDNAYRHHLQSSAGLNIRGARQLPLPSPPIIAGLNLGSPWRRYPRRHTR
jgi:hypothetical protein